MPDWQSLRRGIDGEVALPGSPAYEATSPAFNARFGDLRPAAVVACASPQDAAEALGFARRHGLALATRAGGHSFAGHSSTRGVLLDLTLMRSVTVAGGLARVGGGARLGEVYQALQAHDLTIPGGTCPPVGVAGLTLGGGLGILGRMYGVTADQLVGAEVVLADGRVLACDDHHQPELFWALRGAGAGNFGVVTTLVFRPVPAPPTTTNVHLAWPHAQAAAVVGAWQGWAPEGPDELAASLKLTAGDDPDRPPAVDVYAAFHGPRAEAARLVEELAGRVGAEPTTAVLTPMTWPQTRRWWAELGDPGEEAGRSSAPQPSEAPCLYARSEFFARPLPAEAVGALLEAFEAGRRAGESRELDFMPWGGAYNRRPPQATAFVHRDQRFQLKHAVVVAAGAPPAMKVAAHRAATRSWASVHRWGSGRVFQNFADPDLEHWAEAYYGPNYDRLVRVKARYDPSNQFQFQQSLPLRP
ncbi:MAG TPA: FAD-binding oxidoreductase [Actinomycetota bacterium]|nr:FAD-binding oxidoreductase [Actinomycetota bacterium]